MKSTAAGGLVPCVALLVLLQLSPTAASEDRRRAGLSRFRTVGSRFVYAPVLLKLDSKREVEVRSEGEEVLIPILAASWVGATQPRLGVEPGAEGTTAVFSVQRPVDPPADQAAFDAELSAALRFPYCVVLGLKPVSGGGPYRIAADHGNGGLGGYFHSAQGPQELEALLESARVYAEIGGLSTLTDAVWRRVKDLPDPMIRFAAMRDVYMATVQRRVIASSGAKIQFLEEILAAMGSELTPALWLRTQSVMRRSDEGYRLQKRLLANREMWHRAARDPNDVVATVAMHLPRTAGSVDPDPMRDLELLGAFLSRESSPDRRSLGAAVHLARGLPQEVMAVPEESLRAMLTGLRRLLDSEPEGVEELQALELLLRLGLAVRGIRTSIERDTDPDAMALRNRLEEALAKKPGLPIAAELRRTFLDR